ncbi:hypothetical protein JRO89_XS11G0039700 [Xanthoceras sorbifolium]|uniref:Uncharacterized protein n=1 Tax=Xanthoceras sorbifolium TaxID=99658 RepID=A0ABQ8HEK3_9ROSI|nr:hypothetical protein JRO89_XS11G0039700 [Xanthoceras sorbifolium]
MPINTTLEDLTMRDLYMPQREGCHTMEFIGLKNVGEKLESRVSRFADIYLLDVTMTMPRGQAMSMEIGLDLYQ